jgi:hypothetical protein
MNLYPSASLVRVRGLQMEMPGWNGVEGPTGRARAAAEALRGAGAWKGALRERMEALSWDRITGARRPRSRMSGSTSARQRPSSATRKD